MHQPLWKAKSSFGKNPVFANAEDLWTACLEYFDWVEANPLISSKPYAFKGEVAMTQAPHVRPMSVGALTLFLGISRKVWESLAAQVAFADVTTRAEEVINTHTYEFKAVDLMSAVQVGRELAGSDKPGASGSGAGAGTVIFKTIYESRP